MNRREVIRLGLLGSGILLSGGWSRVLYALEANSEKRLIVVFLYGGADPLEFFPPIEDDAYYGSRPTLAIKKSEALPLDSLFGLNPALAPLYPLWQNKEMSIIHQFGLPIADRSHGNAMTTIERGVPNHTGSAKDGFLSRAMLERFGSEFEPLRTVALQLSLPLILSGANPAISMGSISELRKMAAWSQDLTDCIESYRQGADLKTAEYIRGSIQKINQKFGDQPGTNYFKEKVMPFGMEFNLSEIGNLISADLGVKLAFTSSFGWDTHVRQKETLDGKMAELARGLTYLRNKLQKARMWESTQVVVLTEFGRCAQENGGRGTDHGHGSAAILLGGNLGAQARGKVLHQWKPMKLENLSEGRELFVYHDYRDIFSELLISQLGIRKDQLKNIFPDFQPKTTSILS